MNEYSTKTEWPVPDRPYDLSIPDFRRPPHGWEFIPWLMLAIMLAWTLVAACAVLVQS